MDFSLTLALSTIWFSVMEGMLCKVLKKMDLSFILTSSTVWSGVKESGYEIFSVLFSILLRHSMNL
jgi:hypothetical protein